MAFAMEIRREQDEAGEDAELDDQGCFEESAPQVLFAFGEMGIRTVGGAVAGQSFHHGRDAGKGGEDAPWVDGGMVGDVV